MRPILFCTVCCMLALCLAYPNTDYAADDIWSPNTATTPDSVWASATATCDGATCKAPEFSRQRRICANTQVCGRGYLRSMCNPAKRIASAAVRFVRIRR